MLLKGNLNGFQHLGIPVVDIEKTQKWYVEKLGFKIIHQPEILTPEGTIFISFLKKEDVTLELYQLLGNDLIEIENRSHGHIDHFAIDVLNVENALEEIGLTDLQIDPGTKDSPVVIPEFWSEGVKYIFLNSINGGKIELNQRFDLSPKRRSNNINGGSHLGIPVTDIEKAEEFYSQFGFEKVMQASIPVGDDEIKVSMLSLNGFTIEFYQLIGSDLDEIKSRKDGHIDHLTFDVNDVHAAYHELSSAGLKPLEESIIKLPFWENGVAYFNIRGPEGEKIEFNQIL